MALYYSLTMNERKVMIIRSILRGSFNDFFLLKMSISSKSLDAASLQRYLTKWGKKWKPVNCALRDKRVHVTS